jgi:hypothetical protein
MMREWSDMSGREAAERMARERVDQLHRLRVDALRRVLEESPARNDHLAVEAIHLLYDADGAWHTVSGDLLDWEDADLREIGWARFHGEEIAEGDEEDGDPIFWDRHRFAATRNPWRLRLDLIESNDEPEEGDDPRVEVHVQGEREWWVREGGVILTGRTQPDMVIGGDKGNWWAYGHEVEADDEREPVVSYNTHHLEFLLRPYPLLGSFDVTGAQRSEVAGRPATVLDAVATQEFASMSYRNTVRDLDFASPALSMWIQGGKRYRFGVDATYGILLSWEALIDGSVASKQVMSDVTVDAPIHPSIFATPADGEGSE